MLYVDFGEVPTADPTEYLEDDRPLPPGYENTPVTAISTGRIEGGFC